MRLCPGMTVAGRLRTRSRCREPALHADELRRVRVPVGVMRPASRRVAVVGGAARIESTFPAGGPVPVRNGRVPPAGVQRCPVSSVRPVGMAARVAVRRVNWLESAACRGKTRLFYSTYGFEDTAAKTLCAGCPVREPCLEHALTVDEPFGIWGGQTPEERGVSRRRRWQVA